MKKAVIISSVIAAIMIIICGIHYNGTVGSACDKVVEQENEIADLKNRLDVSSAEQKSNATKLKMEVTGLNAKRVATDDEIAEAFLQKVLTWDNGTAYDQMRAELFEKYGLDENSSFTQVFLPVNVKTPDGKYNYIDTHKRNSKYESMVSHVSKINTDCYSYFTDVTWSSSDLNGNEATATCIFLYDVTVDGDIKNLEAYTVLP